MKFKDGFITGLGMGAGIAVVFIVVSILSNVFGINFCSSF